MKKEDTVTIHGDEWKFEHIVEEIEECKKFKWKKQKWSPSPALVDKSGNKSTKYSGQKYDPNSTQYKKEGWDDDHCEIYWWSLYDSPDEEGSTGYTNGYNWICTECYVKFVEDS